MTEKEYRRDLQLMDNDVDNGISALYVYLSIDKIVKADANAHQQVAANAIFWNLHVYCLITTIFTNLGRIFGSGHSIHRLIDATISNPQLFSREALRSRKIQAGIDLLWLDHFLNNIWKHNIADLQVLKEQVDLHAEIYRTRYLPIRNKVFAHKVLKQYSQIDALFQETDVTELERMFCFLLNLIQTLQRTLDNGTTPKLGDFTFDLKEIVERSTRRAIIGQPT